MAGRPVNSIEHGGLAALTTELPGGGMRVRRRDLDRHLEVVGAAFAETTIVPCAFGMVVHSAGAVESELLTVRREELLELLDRLEGRAQLNVRARYDEQTVLREIVETEPEVAELRGRTRGLGDAGHFQSIRLGELVAAALEARRADDARRIFDRLAAEAADVVVEEATGTLVLKASLLVDRKRAGAFDSALEQLAAAESPRLSFESIGPLPPTAFARLGP